MSEKTGKKGTYCSLSKWFKWSSSIIILVPVVIVIMAAINLSQGFDFENNMAPWYNQGIGIILIIFLVVSAIWVVLNIIMFFAAGTVRGDGPSPAKIRIGLLIALILVLAPIILGLIAHYNPWISGMNVWAPWVAVFGPMVGYIIGAIMGSSLQHNLD